MSNEVIYVSRYFVVATRGQRVNNIYQGINRMFWCRKECQPICNFWNVLVPTMIFSRFFLKTLSVLAF